MPLPDATAPRIQLTPPSCSKKIHPFSNFTSHRQKSHLQTTKYSHQNNRFQLNYQHTTNHQKWVSLISLPRPASLVGISDHERREGGGSRGGVVLEWADD